MTKDQIDRLIKENMNGSSPQIEIDIRKEAMSEIAAYKIKKEKRMYVLQWILSLFAASACLGSLVFFELLFNRLRIFLFLTRINPLTLKLIFQGFFVCLLVGVFVLMLYTLSAKDDLYNIPNT